MTHKDIINREHPNLVKNWGESAELISFNQVIDLMGIAVKENGNWFTRLFSIKTKLSKFTKWELFKENVKATETTREAPILGGGIIDRVSVSIDIYRRFNRETGEPEYKNIKIL